jgi:plastocyanin
MNASFAALVLAGLLVPPPTSAQEKKPEPTAATPAPKAAFTGHVLFDGDVPVSPPLPSTPEQTKGCCPGDKTVNVTDPSLIVDAKTKALANVLVVVEVPGAKVEKPTTQYVLDQRACVFEPHCLIVPAGATVVLKNSDPVAHNVHVYSARNDGSNNTIAPGAQAEVTFARADKIKIGCDYHPWMSSMLFVVDTPYCALTKDDGSFKIQGLPPGTYKVKLWHESLGRAEAEVVVKDDGSSAPLEVKMAPRKKKD